MAADPDNTQPLSPSTCKQSWGLGPKYLEVPPDEERINKKKQVSCQYLKYGLIVICVALLTFGLVWLTFKPGRNQEGSTLHDLSAKAIQDLQQAFNSTEVFNGTERDRRSGMYEYDSLVLDEDGRPPKYAVGKCDIIGGLRNGDKEDAAKVMVKVAEKGADVIELLSTVPGIGLPFGATDLIIEAFEKDDNWEECILNQVREMRRNDWWFMAHKAFIGKKSQMKRTIQGFDRENKTAEESKQISDNRGDVELKYWGTLRDLLYSMDDISSSTFAPDAGVQRTGAYFVLPYYAAVHFNLLVLRIDWSKKFTHMDQEWFTEYLQNSYKKELAKWIQFYAEVALKYWRKARDEWCKDAPVSGGKCGCKCMIPPFKTYLPKWGKLAAKYGHSQVQTEITRWLETNKIKTGDEVAFKFNQPMTQLYFGAYRGMKWRGYNDVSDSSKKWGWLSCTGQRAYCYLRDCPDEYIVGKTSCSGERFTIENGRKVPGLEIFSGSLLYLKADKTQYLNLYTCPSTASSGFGGQVLSTASAWWNTEEEAFGQPKDNRQAVRIYSNPQLDALFPPWNTRDRRIISEYWTPEREKNPFKKQLLTRPANPVLENGDFVRVRSEYDCGEIGEYGESAHVMDDWFEIVKTTDSPMTNKWSEKPILRLVK